MGARLSFAHISFRLPRVLFAAGRSGVVVGAAVAVLMLMQWRSRLEGNAFDGNESPRDVDDSK